MCRISDGFYKGLEGLHGCVCNTGVAVSEMAEENIQGMIYYIKHFKRIFHTCKNAYVDLDRFRTTYHQRHTEESHKDPEVVSAVDPKDCPNTLETVEDYIRRFRGVDGKPLSYRLRDDLIAPVAASDPTYRANGIYYFTHDEEMIADGSILSGPVMLGSEPEAVRPFMDFSLQTEL